jgi:hypothetical protein
MKNCGVRMKQPSPKMEPPPHRQTLEELARSVEALGWRLGPRPVVRQPAADASAFCSHYSAFRGEPCVLEGATARWPLVQQQSSGGGGALATLSRWLHETPVETLTLCYRDEPGEDDVTFNAAARRPCATTFGAFADRAESAGAESVADRRCRSHETARASAEGATAAPGSLSMEYLQKLRIPLPSVAAETGGDPGLQRLAAALTWPAVPCMAAARAERETNLWAGRCLTSQLHFDGYDNIHR